MTTTYLWNPAPPPSLPVRGLAERLPVNRLFFVGRNYHAHAVEMGAQQVSASASAKRWSSICTVAPPSMT